MRLLQNDFGLPDERLSGFSGFNRLLGAVKKDHPDFFFQLVNLHTERGLSHLTVLRRLPEVFEFINRDYVV
jgi:hypothetical protein